MGEQLVRQEIILKTCWHHAKNIRKHPEYLHLFKNEDVTEDNLPVLIRQTLAMYVTENTFIDVARQLARVIPKYAQLCKVIEERQEGVCVYDIISMTPMYKLLWKDVHNSLATMSIDVLYDIFQL